MSSDYQRAVDLLDKLSPSELTDLMVQTSKQLQKITAVAEGLDEAEAETDANRRYLPRLPQMISWGIVVPLEDKLYVKDQPNKPALLLDSSRVAYHGEILLINEWAKKITGWKSVNVYDWVIVERTGEVLDDMRQRYMKENRL